MGHDNWKKYMVVLFINEDSSPGIISSNWCIKNEKECFYPPVKSFNGRNAILRKRDAPDIKNWQICAIRVLSHYDSLDGALEGEKSAKAASSLDIEEEILEKIDDRRRFILDGNRKLKSEKRPGESDEEEDKSDSGKETFDCEPRRKKLRLNNKLPQYPKPDDEEVEEANWMSPAATPPPAVASISYGGDESNSRNSSNGKGRSKENEIQSKGCSEHCHNWKDISAMMIELKEGMKDLSERLKVIENQNIGQLLNGRGGPDITDDEVPNLPLKTVQDFLSFEDNLKESGLRKKLIIFLNKTSGSDFHRLTHNVLQLLFTDELGVKITLSGKSNTEGEKKEKLVGTTLWKVICYICQKKYEVPEEKIKTSAGKWLHQSKNRQDRRLKKKASQNFQNRPQTENFSDDETD